MNIEQEIQAKGLTAPRITPADIEANIASEHYFTAEDGVGRANRGQTSEGGKNPVDVMVIGYDNDGVMIIRSSRMSRADALFMLEKAKQWVLT